MASQITSLTIVYSTLYSGADQRKHQSSASLAFVLGIHRWPANSLHRGPVTPKMFPFDYIIIWFSLRSVCHMARSDRKCLSNWEALAMLTVHCRDALLMRFWWTVFIYYYTCIVSAGTSYFTHTHVRIHTHTHLQNAQNIPPVMSFIATVGQMQLYFCISRKHLVVIFSFLQLICASNLK